MTDDNDRIISTLIAHIDNKNITDLIKKRLEFGRKKYGHGISINQNLEQYQSGWNGDMKIDWRTMLLEELVDGMVYATTEIIRVGEVSKEAEPLILVLEKLRESIILLGFE